MAERTDYVLGRDVTEQARSQESRTTGIVSLRLSAEEMDALCVVADREGKYLSDVVRDAVRRHVKSVKAKQPATPAS